MSRLRSVGVLVAAVALSALLAACSSSNEATSTPSSTSTFEPTVTASPTTPPITSPTTGPTETPTVTLTQLPGTGDTVEVRAPIVSVDVRVAESFPPQYFVEVVSALPNGCHHFSRYEVSRDGTTVHIDVWNTVPANLSVVACAMIYGEVTSNVALGSDFVSGVEYTLEVNDMTQTFVAQ
jgi:ABC-type transport system substrate-binding protein